MPLREVLFGVSVATLVPTTLVGSTLATSFHIVETVLGTRLLTRYTRLALMHGAPVCSRLRRSSAQTRR
ncbi:hypothetical protein BOC57_13825 [Burkholderia pseudomallei]|nr:hypothetical protein BOC57_13825 [Burkholderia pseudomallei]